MRHDLTQTLTPWFDSSSLQHYPTVESDYEVDVAIIGGGITGITAAELLKQAGKRVAVIDLGRIGHGETGHTTAHLTEVLDTSFQDLLSNFGVEGGHLACQASRKAIQRIEANVLRYNIECDFKRVPAWIFSESALDIDWLEKEAEAAMQLSVPSSLLDEAPLPFKVQKALRFDHQAQFHPFHYLQALSSRVHGDGSYIFEKSRVIDIVDGEPCTVITSHGKVRAKNVIVAANVPINNKFFLHTKIAAYRSYAIAFPLKQPMIEGHLFWDTKDPYHYIRTANINGQEFAIVGGEDHKTGQDVHTDAHFQRLEDWCADRFEVESVPYRWSGQIINPVDGLPYVGRNSMSDHIFVATGYAGNGMTFGTMAGMLLSDLVTGQQNPWADLFDATRVKPWAGAKNFISENIDFATHLVGDRLTPAQEDNVAVLRENEGALVRMGAKKVAAYRDEEGKMHLMSPVCPHLGCYVSWNHAEKSWDCPCHGSRFDPYGKLLNGPAVTDLASEEGTDDLLYLPEKYDPASEREVQVGSPLMTFMCPCKPKTT